jgi:hypothetical protein
VRFLGTIQLPSRPVLAQPSHQRSLHTLLDAELTDSLDCWDAHFDRARDSLVCQRGAAGSFIGFEQDTGMRQVAGRSFPGGNPALELRTFLFHQVDVIKLSHTYYNKLNRKPVTGVVTKY